MQMSVAHATPQAMQVSTTLRWLFGSTSTSEEEEDEGNDDAFLLLLLHGHSKMPVYPRPHNHISRDSSHRNASTTATNTVMPAQVLMKRRNSVTLSCP